MNRRRSIAAFTLIELLTVIAIIAIIVAIAAPAIGNFRKGNAMLSANRQMLDAVARARQLAISDHTTVYMVFVPPNYWQDPAYSSAPLTQNDRRAATNLVDDQLTGYNYISLHSVGDQPGQMEPRYLSSWQSLPDTSFIALQKFMMPPNQYINIGAYPGFLGYNVHGFDATTNLPFPLAETRPAPSPYPYPRLPYIAFNYLGQLTSGHDEFIPLAQGSVLYSKNPVTREPTFGPVSAEERPPGNSTNVSYNLIHIDWLTGRARLEHQEVQ